LTSVLRPSCAETQQLTALQTLHERSPQIDGDPVLRDLRALPGRMANASAARPGRPGSQGRALVHGLPDEEPLRTSANQGAQ